MEQITFYNKLSSCFSANGLSHLLTDPQKAQTTEDFIRFLLAENQKYNLTAIRTPDAVLTKHFADSLLAECLIPHGARVLDVGCGGGFPSIPLAIFREDLTITALDSTEKKIKFVQVAAELYRLPIRAVAARAEDAAHGSMREKYDVVIGRAVASLPILAELCLPFVRAGGVFIALKGAGWEEEVSRAIGANHLLSGGGNVAVHHTSLVTSPREQPEQRAFVVVEKKSATPPLYPRPYAQIKKHPL